jgi:hypothetical protein
MINKKTPITDPKIFAQFLKDFIKKQNIDLKDLTKEQRVKKAKGGYISQIDKPLYYSEPGIIPTIKSIRQSFSEGGVPEDIVQIQMLIGILENSQGLSPVEQQLLEELYQDLGRVSGGSK